MRFLLGRTDALGDLVVSLPVQARILERDPGAEIHWLVSPYAAPLLAGQPEVAGIQLRHPETDLLGLLRELRPDAVLNLGHRDRAITVAAQAAGVPLRVARARGLDQILAATHRLWQSRRNSSRHETENLLDFLAPFGWSGGVPACPRLTLTAQERDQGHRDLAAIPARRLGIALKSSGSSAYPSAGWWDQALPLLKAAGWNPVVLSPGDASDLPATDLRGLLGRIAACDAFLGPSTGPLQIAAALGVPVLALMGRSPNRGPSRWAPLGERVQVLQYPEPEADLTGGMDRLDPAALLPHLARLRGEFRLAPSR
jgi:ADP-heptose:LPS heptosyltransferase